MPPTPLKIGGLKKSLSFKTNSGNQSLKIKKGVCLHFVFFPVFPLKQNLSINRFEIVDKFSNRIDIEDESKSPWTGPNKQNTLRTPLSGLCICKAL